MKRVVLLLCLVVLLTGCDIKPIDNDNIDSIIDSVLTKEIELSNSYFDGYKYYLPRGLRLAGKKDYNAKLVSGKNTYYLFVDVIAYYNKVEKDFEPSNGYYSKELNYNGKRGYIEITEVDGLYFIEIMYNYAKIETLVEERYLNSAIVSATCEIIIMIIDGNVDRKFDDNIGLNLLKFDK